jgi:hypothetical protein
MENLKRVSKLTDLCWVVDVLVGFGYYLMKPAQNGVWPVKWKMGCCC